MKIKKESTPSWFKFIRALPSELDADDFNLKRIAKCSCKKRYVFYCQGDKTPEYYTFITFECECGTLIKMKFPVN